MKQENMPKGDFVVSILLMGFGLWVVIHSFQMPRFEDLGADPFSVPGIVPGILGAIIFLLSLVVFIRSMRQKGFLLEVNRSVISRFFRDPAMQRMLLSTALCVVYGFVLVGRINYYLATFLFVQAFLVVFQFRSYTATAAKGKLMLTSLAQAVLTAGIVGAVFRYLFLVDLP